MKYGNMKRKNKNDKAMAEEIEMDLEVAPEDEVAPESEMMQPEIGPNLEAQSSADMIRELKARGILPEDFEEPEEDMEADMEEEEEDLPEIELE